MIMFVGEQPGDVEERQGRPFVGPAGGILDRALIDAGIERSATYVTNAVKHFKFEGRGKRRIHSKPSAREAAACRPWLEREIRIVHPWLIVALGATASQALLGPKFRVTREGGRILPGEPWAQALLATVHPSSILRQSTDEDRHRAYDAFVADLRVASDFLHKG
jgi:DNA polymerase